MESTGSAKPRDALLEKLKERIKDRDRALEVKNTNTHTHFQIHTRDRNEWLLGRNSERTPEEQNALDTEDYPSQLLFRVDHCTVPCDSCDRLSCTFSTGEMERLRKEPSI